MLTVTSDPNITTLTWSWRHRTHASYILPLSRELVTPKRARSRANWFTRRGLVKISTIWSWVGTYCNRIKSFLWASCTIWYNWYCMISSMTLLGGMNKTICTLGFWIKDCGAWLRQPSLSNSLRSHTISFVVVTTETYSASVVEEELGCFLELTKPHVCCSRREQNRSLTFDPPNPLHSQHWHGQCGHWEHLCQ